MSEPTKQTTGEQVLEMCGPMPTAPGVAAAFDGDRVELTRDTYLKLQTYREYVTVWSVCAATLP